MSRRGRIRSGGETRGRRGELGGGEKEEREKEKQEEMETGE